MEKRKTKTASLSELSKGGKLDKNRLKKAKDFSNRQSGKREQDERFLELKPDKNKNHFAVVRLMPNRNLESQAGDFIEIFQHFFESYPKSKKWFIETCPTSFGDECPVCQFNSSIWDSNEDQARRQKRNKVYLTNVYVVSNPQEPETEGKVLLFKLHGDLIDKILEKMTPSDPTEKALNVFNPIIGCNLKLKMKKDKKEIGGRNVEVKNFGLSSFLESSRLGDDKTIDQIFEMCYDLEEFVKTDSFWAPKSYDKLKTSLSKFLNIDDLNSDKEDASEEEMEEEAPEVAVEESEDVPAEETSEEDDFEFDDLDEETEDLNEKEPEKTEEAKVEADDGEIDDEDLEDIFKD